MDVFFNMEGFSKILINISKPIFKSYEE